MSGFDVNVIPHYMTEEELTEKFGKNGWKQLPDAISRKYHFIRPLLHPHPLLHPQPLSHPHPLLLAQPHPHPPLSSHPQFVAAKSLILNPPFFFFTILAYVEPQKVLQFHHC